MIVLDEQLRRSRIADEIASWYRGQVVDIGTLRPATVIKDDNIEKLLRTVRQPTFVTINVKDFWLKIRPHSRYCVVTIDIVQEHVTVLPPILRQLLQQPEFVTKASRMGKVIRVRGGNVRYYGLDRQVFKL